MMWFYISLGITLAISIAELVCCFFKFELVRKILKPFCLLGIIISCIFINKNVNLLIYFALGFGLIGDILLIFEDKKICFLLGIIAFFINHIFFIALMMSLFTYQLPLGLLIPLGILVLVSPLLTLPIFKKQLGIFQVPGPIYGFTLIVELILSIMLLFDHRFQVWNITLIVGVILFIASDSILSYTHFFKKIDRREFPIMLTYLAAQMLIAFSLCFIIG